MNFISPNKADNVTIAVAAAFVGKLQRLGFRVSALHLDESEGGPSETSYVPVADVPAEELSADTKYNCIVYCGGNWHNVAKLILEWGTGRLQDFIELAVNLAPGSDPNQLAMNIPGAAKAVEKLMEKA